MIRFDSIWGVRGQIDKMEGWNININDSVSERHPFLANPVPRQPISKQIKYNRSQVIEP